MPGRRLAERPSPSRPVAVPEGVPEVHLAICDIRNACGQSSGERRWTRTHGVDPDPWSPERLGSANRARRSTWRDPRPRYAPGCRTEAVRLVRVAHRSPDGL